MPIPLVINGQEVSVQDVSTAAAIILEIQKQQAASANGAAKTPSIKAEPPPKEQPVAPATAPLRADFDSEGAQVALKFLKTIREGSSDGIASEALMEVFGVSKKKAIGSRSAGVNKVLISLGLNVKAVYKNPRTATGQRAWKPGRQMNNAIAMIEQRLAAH
jgi:hypothetical protein